MKYWDYSLNMVNPAQAWATAKVAREVKAEGKAWRVEFCCPNSDQWLYWSGGWHCCLSLAKELLWNKYQVKLYDYSGVERDIRQERF